MPSGQLMEEGVRRVSTEDRAAIPIPVRDEASRSLLLNRLLAALDDSAQVPSLARSGLTAEVVDQLRRMSAADAVRLASSDCGIGISIDGEALRQRLAGMQRDRSDRELLESFLRAGASPKLVARLFAMSDSEVRTARRIVAPAWAMGGRPRMPDEAQRLAVSQSWEQLRLVEMNERERYMALSRQFPDLPIMSLESVIASTLS